MIGDVRGTWACRVGQILAIPFVVELKSVGVDVSFEVECY